MLSFLGALAAAWVLVVAVAGGAVGLIAVGLGMLLIDVAVQTGQVANQTRIFALQPELRSRLNTAYMTSAFLGGTIGSWAGVRIYLRYGWLSIPALVAIASGAALVRHLVYRRSGRDEAGSVSGGGGLAAARGA